MDGVSSHLRRQRRRRNAKGKAAKRNPSNRVSTTANMQFMHAYTSALTEKKPPPLPGRENNKGAAFYCVYCMILLLFLLLFFFVLASFRNPSCFTPLSPTGAQRSILMLKEVTRATHFFFSGRLPPSLSRLCSWWSFFALLSFLFRAPVFSFYASLLSSSLPSFYFPPLFLSLLPGVIVSAGEHN